MSSTIEQQTVEGTWVTTRSTLRGTHLGAFLGTAPTGKTIESRSTRSREGKVVEHFGVSDWLRALIAFEIVAAPVSAPVKNRLAITSALILAAGTPGAIRERFAL